MREEQRRAGLLVGHVKSPRVQQAARVVAGALVTEDERQELRAFRNRRNAGRELLAIVLEADEIRAHSGAVQGRGDPEERDDESESVEGAQCVDSWPLRLVNVFTEEGEVEAELKATVSAIFCSHSVVGGKVWEVSLDGKVMDRFSRMEDAVQAVDYEIMQMGRGPAASALEGAGWRRAPAHPGEALTVGEALRLAVWQRVMGR